jgi:hypothetical protein
LTTENHEAVFPDYNGDFCVYEDQYFVNGDPLSDVGLNERTASNPKKFTNLFTPKENTEGSHLI